MDINNNQQINTFLKGMNTDVSDALIDSSQYRYAENLRLVTNTDSNSGELRLVDGTDVFKKDKPWNDGNIKAMTSIRDLLIVVNTDDEIWVQDTSMSTFDKGDWVCLYKPKTWTIDEVDDQQELDDRNNNEAFGPYLSLVTRWETPTVIKLYIADGVHQLMYINIVDGMKTISSGGSPIIGISNLLADVETTLKPIEAKKIDASGVIKPAKVQYVYRFYKLGGAATTLSATSNVVTIYKTSNEGYTENDEKSNKAVELTIPECNIPELEYVQIYRINYIQIGHQPEVSLIYDEKWVNKFVDRGVNIEDKTLTELLSMIKLNIIPTVIESKNDYMFAANIKYKDNELDNIITNNWENQYIGRAYSSGDFENQTVSTDDPAQYQQYALEYNEQLNTENILTYDPKYWRVPGTNNIGGVGQYVSWRFTTKSVFVDKTNCKYRDLTKQEKEEDQVRSLRRGEVYRYGIVFYNKKGQRSSVFWIADIMVPQTDNTNAPAMYNRYTGDPIYEMKQVGIQFVVSHMPETCVGAEIVRCPRSMSDRITITQGIAGFPYRIYTRKTWNMNDADFKDTEMICPTGFYSSNYFQTRPNNATTWDDQSETSNPFLSMGISDNKVLMFSSPEYVYQPDDIKNIIQQNKNNIVVQQRYMYKCDTEQGLDMYRKIQSSGWKYVRVKTYNDNGDQSANSYWFRLKDNDAYEFGPNGVRRIPENSWLLDEQAAGANVSKEYSTDSRLIFEDNDAKEKPVAVQEIPLIPGSSDNPIYNIGKVGYPEVPQWNALFDDQDNIRWKDDITIIDTGTQFVAWSVPSANNNIRFGSDMKNEHDGFDKESFGLRYTSYYPVGSTGKCMVLTIDNPMELQYSAEHLYTPIMEIRKKSVPYGGPSTVDTSTYLSYGNYMKMEESSSTMFPEPCWSVNVFDGDCYPGVFTYNASHSWYDAGTAYGVRNTTIYYTPIESDIDLSATYGDLYPNLQSGYKYYIQDKASSVSMMFTQTKDSYLYNTAYGAEPEAITYQTTKRTKLDTDKYDTRIHHSELKTNGEHIDNWLNFRTMNFIDVDSRFGEITNMRLFKDRLLYWQDNATGVLSVNERTIVNDMDDNKIILGTGDVLQRYDYISTLYGMKPFQYEAEVQSNTTQYWWDGHNKEILGYAGGMELAPLAKIKNVTNYINDNDEIEHPSLSYDIKFNELMSSVVDNNTLSYNEQVQQFTSTYTFNPIYRTTINNELLLTDNNTIYKWNDGNGEVSTLFGSAAHPLVQYVVNNQNIYVKVFDISTFGGRFYGGDEGVNNLTFTFKTPLKQHSTGTGLSLITNREYDFRLDIPRNNDSSYGDRMRGKTMQCELKSNSNSTDFSLQYIVTKYRMSWS